ncbi:MAG: bifunctional glycosyltransferase/class I SAM-dependent methyltransferase [Elusimicrobia bacterium]|nr:bifunctional glycosyltransferase/class I SAM-dependent methyltransferase [Elusimicrobiota bacterium]
MRLSIVIPAYNEELRLPGMLERLRAATKAEEVDMLVVDDGSTDRTGAIAQAAGARVLRLERNGGRGAAVRAGMAAAPGELILEMDADGSVDFEAIGRFVAHLDRHPGVDALSGSRNADGSVIAVPQPFLRVFLGNGFLYAARAFFGWDVTDFTLGFKMFRREAALDVVRHQFDSGYLAEAELLVAARGRGWRVVEMPVRWVEYGGSRIRPLRESWRSFWALLAMIRRAARGGYDAPAERPSFAGAARRTKALYRGLGWPALFARIRFITAPYDRLEPYVPLSGLVIDLGCGYGTFSHLLALMAPGRRVLGLDLDAAKIARAPLGGKNIVNRLGDIRTEALEPAACILLIHVLHHLDSFVAQERLLTSCREKLNDGGTLVICEVNCVPRWKYGLGWLADRVLYPGDPIFYRFPAEMHELLARCGFQSETRLVHEGTPFSHAVYVCTKA